MLYALIALSGFVSVTSVILVAYCLREYHASNLRWAVLHNRMFLEFLEGVNSVPPEVKRKRNLDRMAAEVDAAMAEAMPHMSRPGSVPSDLSSLSPEQAMAMHRTLNPDAHGPEVLGN